jgi:hypothetical protein
VYRILRRVLAFLRLSPRAVCEESRGLGPRDYHDWPDEAGGRPEFFGPRTCGRCGKSFRVD